jgi:hypothetical protein
VLRPAIAARTRKARCVSSGKLRTVIDDMWHPLLFDLNDCIILNVQSFCEAPQITCITARWWQAAKMPRICFSRAFASLYSY